MGNLHTKITARRVMLLTCALAGLMALGCGSSKELGRKETSTQEKPREERKAPLSVYEATLNPSDFDEEVDAIKRVRSEKKPRAPLEIPEDSTVVREEIIQGFRIQIFASASIDEANATKVVAVRKFAEDSIYVVYDPPVYKVRVGDFPSRLEANRRLTELINQGYPDAWVVADRIIRRKLVRIPASEMTKEK